MKTPRDAAARDAAGPTGGLRALGAPLVVVDSITEAVHAAPGAVVVCGSHAGASVVPYALAARPRLAVFNDAGVGRDGAGIAALAALQAAGVAACAVAHTSARIGEARSTLADGVIAHANEAALALGARIGLPLAPWLLSAP